MKSLRFALRAFAAICVAFFMSSASCDLFQNADVVTFSAVLERPFPINETIENPAGKPYDSEPKDEILDAATVNADFAKYKDLIEDIEINKVTYVLSGFGTKRTVCPGAIAFSGGTLTFSDPDATGTSGTVVANVSVPNLETAQGVETELDIDQAEADAIAAILKKGNKVKIDAHGNLSCVPLQLTVTVKVDCTISARVL